MIIDDEEIILEVSKIILEAEGYEVDTFSTGLHLSQLKEDFPDLILLDVLLSGEDGRILCHQLKSNPRTKNIPVILFSAHSTDDMGEILNTNGPDYFLPKPFEIAELKHAVGLLLKRSSEKAFA